MEPFFADRIDSEKRQVVSDQLLDDATVWRRQSEHIDVTWLAHSLRLTQRFYGDETNHDDQKSRSTFRLHERSAE